MWLFYINVLKVGSARCALNLFPRQPGRRPCPAGRAVGVCAQRGRFVWACDFCIKNIQGRAVAGVTAQWFEQGSGNAAGVSVIQSSCV